MGTTDQQKNQKQNKTKIKKEESLLSASSLFLKDVTNKSQLRLNRDILSAMLGNLQHEFNIIKQLEDVAIPLQTRNKMCLSWLQLIETSKKLRVVKANDEYNDDVIHRDYNKREIDHQLYKPKVPGKYKTKYGILSNSMFLLETILDKMYELKYLTYKLSGLLSLFGISKFKSKTAVIEFFKNWSVHFKTYNELIKNRHIYVDIGRTFGYNRDFSKVADGIISWFKKQAKYQKATSIDLKDRHYMFEYFSRKFMDRNFSPISQKRATLLPFYEWLSLPGNRAKAGASSEKHVLKGIDLKKTKWTSSMLLDLDNIYNICINNLFQQKSVALEKNESEKNRLIVSSDIYTYLVTAYIDYIMNNWLVKNKDTTMFYSGSGKFKLFMKYNDLSGKVVFLPIDQSNFDWNISLSNMKSMYYSIKNKIKVLINGLDNSDYITDTFCSLIDNSIVNLFNHEISVRINNEIVDKFIAINGLPSGVKMTAFFGSMSSWVYWQMANFVSENFEDVNINNLVNFKINTDAVSQGDDIGGYVNSYLKAELIVRSYEKLGLSVNAKKTFISTRNNEFLRILTDGSNIYGFPLRGLLSVLVRNPVNRRSHPDENEMGSIVTKWITVCSRGIPFELIKDYMIDDLSKRHRLSKKIIVSILKTPASVGGIGLHIMGIEHDQSKRRVLNFTRKIKDIRTKYQLVKTAGFKRVADWWQDNFNYKISNRWLDGIGDAIVESYSDLDYTVVKPDYNPGDYKKRSKFKKRWNNVLNIDYDGKDILKFVLNIDENLARDEWLYDNIFDLEQKHFIIGWNLYSKLKINCTKKALFDLISGKFKVQYGRSINFSPLIFKHHMNLNAGVILVGMINQNIRISKGSLIDISLLLEIKSPRFLENLYGPHTKLLL
jgi:hypothetical protein